MSRRVLLGFLGLVVVVLVALEVPLGVQYGRTERRNVEAKVERDAVALASLSQTALRTQSLPQKQAIAAIAYRYGHDTGGRVVIVDRRGVALIDTDPRTNGVESFQSRPEIQRALQRPSHDRNSPVEHARCGPALRRGPGGLWRPDRRRRPCHVSDLRYRLACASLLADPRGDRRHRACRDGRRRSARGRVRRQTVATCRERGRRGRSRRSERAGTRARRARRGSFPRRGLQRHCYARFAAAELAAPVRG